MADDLRGVWIEAAASESRDTRAWAYRAAVAGFVVTKRTGRNDDPTMYLVRLPGTPTTIDESVRRRIQRVVNGVEAAGQPPSELNALTVSNRAPRGKNTGAGPIIDQLKRMMPSRRWDAPNLVVALMYFEKIDLLQRGVKNSEVYGLSPRATRDYVIERWEAGDHGVYIAATAGDGPAIDSTVGASKSKPAAAKSKPTASKPTASKPAASKSKPAASEPAAAKSKPAASKSKPAASKSKPAASKSKPAASKSKPARRRQTLPDGTTIEIITGRSGVSALFHEGELVKCGTVAEVEAAAKELEGSAKAKAPRKKSTRSKPSKSKPAASKPEEPAASKPEEPAASQSKQPEESAASKPTVSKPEEPAASKPTVSKPEEPAASKPTASEPAASKPAASKPEEPAGSKPAASKPTKPADPSPQTELFMSVRSVLLEGLTR